MNKGTESGAMVMISEMTVSLVICGMKYSLEARRLPQASDYRVCASPALTLWPSLLSAIGGVLWLFLVPCLCKAVAAIDGSVGLGFERYLRFVSTVSANGGEVFPRTTGGGLSVVAAGLAALRLVLETALGIKFLLTAGEDEFRATFLT